MLGPKSPRLVQISVTSAFFNTLSKFIEFFLLHKIFFTPEYLSKRSNCDIAFVTKAKVSSLFGASE